MACRLDNFPYQFCHVKLNMKFDEVRKRVKARVSVRVRVWSTAGKYSNTHRKVFGSDIMPINKPCKVCKSNNVLKRSPKLTSIVTETTIMVMLNR